MSLNSYGNSLKLKVRNLAWIAQFQDGDIEYDALGFIEEVVIETDALGLMETKSRQTRAHKKKAQNTRMTRYTFVKGVQKSKAYKRYFSPSNIAVERDLMKILDVVRILLLPLLGDVANTFSLRRK